MSAQAKRRPRTSRPTPYDECPTLAAAEAASESLLHELGALGDPRTSLDAAEEVESLAASMVAYCCVPNRKRGRT